MAAEIQANGGFVAASDLASYGARPSIVVRGRYRGYRLAGTYLPASGATTIEALQIMERFPVDRLDAGARAALVSRALLLSFHDRDAARGPPHADARRLTSREWAAERAREIGVAAPAGATVGVGEDREPAHTTHLSVVDSTGMAVSMTQSLGPTGGARVASPELGFLYAATLGGYLGEVRPGDRPWSSQSPLMIEREGRLVWVLGGAGSRRIISALVSTISRLADDGVGLEEAISAPRLHPSGTTVYLELPASGPGWGDARAALAAVGLQAQPREPGVYFARLNGVAVDPGSGELQGVADPRWAWGAAGGPGGGAGR